MKTVAELLKHKANSNTFTIQPDATVLEAISLMADKGIGALIVTKDNAVVGIVSERDYARKVVLMERSSYDTAVSEIMSTQVISVKSTEGTKRCMQLMTDKRLRHLPVVDDGELKGMISIGDIVKDIISHQESLIEQLENYIRG